MGEGRLWILAVLLAASASLDCGKTRGPVCDGPIAVVNEPVTDDLLALPVIANLEDVKPVKHDVGCSEYHDDEHRAKLGPLAARYTAWDYKGLPITSNATLFLSSATCGGSEVTFTMATASVVRLRHDPKRDLYIVSNEAGAKDALLLRLPSAKR